MQKRVGLALVAMVAQWLGGCGPVCNVATGNLEPYGGLGKDAEFLEQYYHPRFSSFSGGVGGGGGRGAVLLLALVAVPVLLPLPELSLTLIGDTLTLPLTLYVYQKRHGEDDAQVTVSGNPTVPAASLSAVSGPPPEGDAGSDDAAMWHRMAEGCLGNLSIMTPQER
jgi:hypothetical protein